MEKVIVDRVKKMECLLGILDHKDIKGQFAHDMRELLYSAKDYINFTIDDIDYAIISDIEAVGITYIKIDALTDPRSGYASFIKEYGLKCRKAHLGRKRYISALSSYNKPITLMCIIDIPYMSNNAMYNFFDANNKMSTRVSNHLPFSKEMLQIVQLMSTYDAVIFRTHCINDDRPKRTDVKYFIPRALGTGMQQQDVTYCRYFERCSD